MYCYFKWVDTILYSRFLHFFSATEIFYSCKLIKLRETKNRMVATRDEEEGGTQLLIGKELFSTVNKLDYHCAEVCDQLYLT